MPTQKQIEANRLNALKSTGPTTAAGKRISSQNALKSGLDAASQFVIGETSEEFAQLQSEWYQHHAPANPEERLQVDHIVRNEWLLRRFFRIEAQLWEHFSMKSQRGTAVELGEAFATSSPVIMRLHRRIVAAEKAGKDARIELRRLKEEAQAKETKAETEQLGSFRTSPLSRRPTDFEIARVDLPLPQKLAENPPVASCPPESAVVSPPE